MTTRLKLEFSDNTVVNLESIGPRPPLGFMRFCYDWTADFDIYTVYNADKSVYRKGISVPTRNEIKVGRTTSVRHVDGLPDPCQMVQTGYTTELSKRGYPEFIKEIWRMAAPHLTRAQIDQAYDSTYQTDRAFNNGAQGEDGQAAITCAGAVHKIIGKAFTMGGRLVYPIETIRGDGPAPDPTKVNPWLTPWLFFPATTSRREKDPAFDGERDPERDGWISGLKWEKEDVQEPFWQLGGTTVWIPLLSRYGTNFIDAFRMRPLLATDRKSVV